MEATPGVRRMTSQELAQIEPKAGMVVWCEAHDNFALEYKLLQFLGSWEVQVTEVFARTGKRHRWHMKECWDAETARMIVIKAHKEGLLREERVYPSELW